MRALDFFCLPTKISRTRALGSNLPTFSARPPRSAARRNGASSWSEVPQESYILTWSCSFVLLLTRMLVVLSSRSARQTPVSTKCSPNEYAGKNCGWRSAKFFGARAHEENTERNEGGQASKPGNYRPFGQLRAIGEPRLQSGATAFGDSTNRFTNATKRLCS